MPLSLAAFISTVSYPTPINEIILSLSSAAITSLFIGWPEAIKASAPLAVSIISSGVWFVEPNRK